MNKQKIIYICGLGHSGSTILDLSLGAHPEIVGLGELHTLLDDHSRDRHLKSLCSCGKNASECIFWKDISQEIILHNKTEERYELILRRFKEKFGSDKVLVDSSKNSYIYLKYLDEHYDLKVLFLTRDFRSWAYSRHLATGKPYLYFVVRWQLENIKLLHQLRKMKIEFLRVGYEELALYPEHLFGIISKYVEISNSEKMLSPENTNSHIVSGNIARVDSEKKMRWIYDSRWFLSGRVTITGPLTFFLSKKNRRFVYSNIASGDIRNFYIFGTAKREEMDRKYN